MIYIIRHGSTKLNSANKIRGWLDVPLDTKGKREARDIAPEVKKKGIDIIVASDLDRTQETAHIICTKTGIPFKEATKDFRPWNVGIWSGKNADEAHKVLKELSEKEPNKRIEKGESFNDFKDRFINGIRRIEKKYSNKRIGIVTHYRGDRIYEAWKAKGFPKDNEVDLKVFNSKGIDPGKLSK